VWLSEQFWIDLSVDALSMGLLSLGTWRLFALLG